MKKHLLSLTFALLVSPLLFAQDMNFFQGNWNEVMAKAKAEKKVVMVDFWAPWCGPCRVMNAKTFGDPTIAKFSNTNLIAYKLNTDEGEGPQKSREYKITGIPCIVFFDANGKEIHRAVGYHTPEQFMPQMQEALRKAGVKWQSQAPADPKAEQQFPTQFQELNRTFAQAQLGEPMLALLEEAYALGRTHNEFALVDVKKK